MQPVGAASRSKTDAVIENRLVSHSNVRLPFAEVYADETQAKDAESPATVPPLTSAEMQRYRAKTQHALLLLCLHIGNDPPDFVRIEPCAKLECWTDPLVAQAKFIMRGSEGIADTLEQQYRSIQKDAMYKKVFEATIDEAKQQLQSMRKKAKDGRVLVHYNGHGMPKATHLGEIWFFDKDKTHYVPFNISDMSKALSTPSSVGDSAADSPNLFVMDCNSAGSLLGFWNRENIGARRPKDMFICACGDGEMLPMNPLLPADILTSALTTPLRMALEWYTSYSFRRSLLPHVTEDMVRNVPGDLAERKTPLGELNWILTAVMDTIAWCTMTPTQFHQLFRQDLIVKSLFRNFLLADKVLREVGCTPMTLPALAETTHSHSMWETWEAALEGVLGQLPLMLNSDLSVNPHYVYRPSTFWVDQLTAFEAWVEGGDRLELPDQLPCVVLALTQVSYRVRALTVLAKYLHSGPAACQNVILCGIIPYISKLTGSNPEVFFILCIVWLQVTRHDPVTACVELGRANVDRSLIRLLMLDASSVTWIDGVVAPSPAATPATATGPGSHGMTISDTTAFFPVDGVDVDRCKSVACYIICRLFECGGEKLQLSCWNNSILKAVFSLLYSPRQQQDAELRSWCCLLLGTLFASLRHAREFISREYASRVELFSDLLTDKSPSVRSSAVKLFGSFVGVRFDLLSPAEQEKRAQAEKSIIIKLRDVIYDHSSSVREEAAVACARLLYFYAPMSPDAPASSQRGSNHLLNPALVTAHRTGDGMDFRLQEPQLKVRSLLSASRPTTNAALDDTLLMSTSVLVSKDDPLPPAQWDASKLTPVAQKFIADILHDCSLMLATMHDHCDQFLIRSLLAKYFKTDEMPRSNRVASEGEKMAQAVDVNHTRHLTEVERSRNTRNLDLMRQHCLDIAVKKWGDAGKVGAPSTLIPPTPASGMSPGGASTAGLSAASPDVSMFKTAAVPAPDAAGWSPGLLAAEFRLLEPHLVLVDRQKVCVFDYDSGRYAMQMAHGLETAVKSMHLVNDLAENPAVLLLDQRGCFTLFSDLLHAKQRPRQVSSFSCTNRIVSTISVVTGYRQHDATVFCAGPIGVEDATRNQIALLSLAKEQLVHSIGFAGEAPVLAMYPHNRGMFAGFADGVVRHYDDRSNTGNMAQLSIIRVSTSTPAEPIFAVGVFASDENTLYTCSSKAIRIFDVRQTSKPKKVVELANTRITSSATPTHSASASFSLGGHAAQAFAAFRTGVYTNLCCVVGTDGQADVLNHKGDSIIPKTTAKLPVGFIGPGQCNPTGLSHGIKPLFFTGSDLLWIK